MVLREEEGDLVLFFFFLVLVDGPFGGDGAGDGPARGGRPGALVIPFDPLTCFPPFSAIFRWCKLEVYRVDVRAKSADCHRAFSEILNWSLYYVIYLGMIPARARKSLFRALVPN